MLGDGVCIRPLRKAAFRKQRMYGALRGRDLGHMDWRWDHFRGWGELEGEV